MSVFDIDHTRHRSPINAVTHVMGAIVAYNFYDSKPSVFNPTFLNSHWFLSKTHVKLSSALIGKRSNKQKLRLICAGSKDHGTAGNTQSRQKSMLFSRRGYYQFSQPASYRESFYLNEIRAGRPPGYRHIYHRSSFGDFCLIYEFAKYIKHLDLTSFWWLFKADFNYFTDRIRWEVYSLFWE